jgi:basic membrane protein A and related proteins
MTKTWPKLGSAIVAALLVACGTGGGGESSDGGGSTGGGGEQDVVRAAWVYPSPRNDGGWSTAHDEARLAVEKEFGDQVETTFIESVSEEPAAATRAIEGLARKGYDIIFTASFGFMDPTLEVAKKYPDIYFEHCSGFKTAENMSNYFGAMEEAKYLAGIAAADHTKNGLMGKVVSFPIPEIVRLTNAFLLGAQSVDPDIRMKVLFTNSFFDPPAEKAAAESLIDAGADVLTQDVDSPATGQVAGPAGAKWVGYNSDASKFAPEAWITAPIWHWDVYYIDTIQSVLDGTWKSQSYYGDLSDGIVGLAPFGNTVKQSTIDKVEKAEQQIINDELEVFTGPIRNQAGEVVVPEGETPSLDELLSMDYFVQGMEGKLPSS